MDDDQSKSRAVLDRIAETATEEEKRLLVQWADSLLSIRASGAPAAKQFAQAIAATAKVSTIKPIVALIGRELTPKEIIALTNGLVSTYRSDLTPAAKVKEAAMLTGKALKALGWDNRGWAGRLGITAAVATVVTLGGQSAGIAALGTAVGVPLWVVFGAGAAFLGEIIERFPGKRPVETSYTIIEARKRLDVDRRNRGDDGE